MKQGENSPLARQWHTGDSGRPAADGVVVGRQAHTMGNPIWGVGGEDAHRRRRATVRYMAAGKESTAGRTSDCQLRLGARRGPG
jgi:hypothetical protein